MHSGPSRSFTLPFLTAAFTPPASFEEAAKHTAAPTTGATALASALAAVAKDDESGPVAKGDESGPDIAALQAELEAMRAQQAQTIASLEAESEPSALLFGPGLE
jgi:hypothetical protein